jgi:outer membrane protein OmpA-like peptidoglycan-associated protein
MRLPSLSLLLLASSLALSACNRSAEPATAPAPDAAATDAAAPAGGDLPAMPATAGEAAAPVSMVTAFDPANVPEATVALPPFPFFQPPSGLASALSVKDRNVAFDREHMIAGDKVVALEGKAYRDLFALTDPAQREYSALEFHRNYADAIAALGGVEASRVQYTDAVNAAFGGREAVDKHYHGTCAGIDCENHTYLLRQGGVEYWIQVSTGAIPLHGQVVVLERKPMASKLGYLDAHALKKTLDAEGHVALYIEFDTDRATLRPDALPAIDQVARLLEIDPSMRLMVDGHTDATGTPERNRELSRQRAEAVVRTLVAKGVAESRLTANGYGSDQPLVKETDEASRAKNRRVELVKKSARAP